MLIFKNKTKLFSKYFSTRENRIKDLITKTFKPSYLELINESYQHSVAPGSETHFKLIVVSDEFKGKSTIQTHQAIYKLLNSEMGEKRDNKLHALTIYAKTPEEWEKSSKNTIPKSPPCMGGDKSNKLV